MNAPAATSTKPWDEMDRQEKCAAVLPLIKNRATYGDIARIFGISRNCIGTIVLALRRSGALPDGRHVPSVVKTPPRSKGNGKKPKPAKKAEIPETPVIEKQAIDLDTAEITISRAAAFDPLPGVAPVHLMDISNGMCRWPVDGELGHDALMCGAPCDASALYCAAHHRLAYVPRRSTEIRHGQGT